MLNQRRRVGLAGVIFLVRDASQPCSESEQTGRKDTRGLGGGCRSLSADTRLINLLIDVHFAIVVSVDRRVRGIELLRSEARANPDDFAQHLSELSLQCKDGVQREPS